MSARPRRQGARGHRPSAGGRGLPRDVRSWQRWKAPERGLGVGEAHALDVGSSGGDLTSLVLASAHLRQKLPPGVTQLGIY